MTINKRGNKYNLVNQHTEKKCSLVVSVKYNLGSTVNNIGITMYSARWALD